MKLPTALVFLSVLILAAGLAGCSSSGGSPMNRIDANRAEYDSWPIEVKQAILDGRVEKGMTPRQVEVAIGKPAKVEVREGRKGTQEVWTYKSGGSNPLKGSSVSIGTYGAGIQTAPLGTGYYEDTFEVVFEDDKVVSSDGPMMK